MDWCGGLLVSTVAAVAVSGVILSWLRERRFSHGGEKAWRRYKLELASLLRGRIPVRGEGVCVIDFGADRDLGHFAPALRSADVRFSVSDAAGTALPDLRDAHDVESEPAVVWHLATNGITRTAGRVYVPRLGPWCVVIHFDLRWRGRNPVWVLLDVAVRGQCTELHLPPEVEVVEAGAGGFPVLPLSTPADDRANE